jgi:prepilin-type N-terminal cleavage/methylation domain-containing protein
MTVHVHKKIARQKGFSILELVVVLGVIALISGAGLTMATGAIKAADRVATQERLNTIKLALDSFAKTYGYLPCPANRIIVPTNTNFGIESRTGTACTAIGGGGMVSSGSIWIGAVPVRTLGLPDNYAGDAWGGKLTYSVSAGVAANPTSYSTAPTQELAVRHGTISASNKLGNNRDLISGGTASNNGGNLRVTFASTTDPIFGRTITTTDRAYISSASYKGSFTPSAVTATTVDFASIPFSAADSGVRIAWLTHNGGKAYAVVSHGADGRGAIPINGTTIPASKACNTSATDGENCDDDSIFLDGFFNDGSQASLFFDDYVVYGSHENSRAAFNPTLYTGTLSSCPAGTCETWCAGCAVNYPGGGTVIPPPTITSGATLCRKIITSNATQCTASCFWGGVTAGGYQRCP